MILPWRYYDTHGDLMAPMGYHHAVLILLCYRDAPTMVLLYYLHDTDIYIFIYTYLYMIPAHYTQLCTTPPPRQDAAREPREAADRRQVRAQLLLLALAGLLRVPAEAVRPRL